MPGALLVRFPKQLDAALGKPPRTSKEHLGTCGVEVGPANGEREWLAGDGRSRVVPTVGRRRGRTRDDNREAVGDRPLAVLRMVTLNIPTVRILTVVRCSLYSSSAVRARSAKPLI